MLPELEALNPRAIEALARAATHLADDEDRLADEVARIDDLARADTLAALPPALARRAALALLREACGDHPDVKLSRAMYSISTRGFSSAPPR